VKPSSSVPHTLRFGVFELDPRAGQLRKKGMKIRLQGQPVEILAMLLERPGETIPREELKKKLWPADTFVDFEQGLNNAMNRLRAALDDDAESPHFIETLPRHGYRFIGSVNGLGEAPVEEAKTTHSAGAFIRLAVLGALALLAVAALLLGLNVRGWRDRLFAGPTRPQILALAVLPLANLSGDPEQEYFADGMTEALITELGKISTQRSPGSRTRCLRTCTGSLTARDPDAPCDVGASGVAFRLSPRRRHPEVPAAYAPGHIFRGSIPDLYIPLSTLRRRPRERLRMTRGRCGSLYLQRMNLSFTTPCRF